MHRLHVYVSHFWCFRASLSSRIPILYAHAFIGRSQVGSVGHPHSCAEACRYVKRKGAVLPSAVAAVTFSRGCPSSPVVSRCAAVLDLVLWWCDTSKDEVEGNERRTPIVCFLFVGETSNADSVR